MEEGIVKSVTHGGQCQALGFHAQLDEIPEPGDAYGQVDLGEDLIAEIEAILQSFE